MLCHAFRFVERVIFLVDPQNLRSQRAVEKAGGVRAGLRSDGAGRANFQYQVERPAEGLSGNPDLLRGD